jgi:hypothetical protein
VAFLTGFRILLGGNQGGTTEITFVPVRTKVFVL